MAHEDQNRGRIGAKGERARALLVEAAAKLVPLLREHAAEADRSAGLPDAVVKGLEEAGLFALQAPGTVGGPQADFRTVFDVYEQLARGCGSSAWVAMILSGGSFFASMLGAQAREEIWGEDPGAGVCSQLVSCGTAHAAEGGVVVSGRWATVSGAHHARWALLAVTDSGGDGGDDEDVQLALVPMNAVAVERTWDVVGMRATRSDTVVADGAFVPQHRLISMGKLLTGGFATDHPDEPLYGASVITALTVTMVAPLLGMGRAALEFALDELRVANVDAQAKGTGRAGTAYVQFAVADAASLIDTATMRVDRALDEIQEAIDARVQLGPLVQSRVHLDAATAASSVCDAVRLLLTAMGTRAFALESPLQRLWRDVEVASRHMTISLGLNREQYGRTLLGVGPDNHG